MHERYSIYVCKEKSSYVHIIQYIKITYNFTEHLLAFAAAVCLDRPAYIYKYFIQDNIIISK